MYCFFRTESCFRDIYDAFFKFSDYYLKDAPVSVTYTDPVNKSVISATSPITVKFIGEVTAEEIVKVIFTDAKGNKVYVEKMNFAGLGKRAKNTEKNEQGRFKRKKRFGKSLANKAPSMLLTIIDRKLKYFGEELVEINTLEAKASQFNHFDGTYRKKSLGQRWNDFNGIKIQRDMYSAFLIMNIADDLKSFDIEKCNKRFDNFYQRHNLEVERLKGHKNLRSIGI